ncbi:aminotransferase class I/II-fold pyridoxal phosphate-dependent enzyme [Youngiibacter multivorans]|uniref:dTDP-4-amino-4,6-dideoxygalactose transaminase n=1 Tax=Youngiibacter multivorans TaxID=937251 RepID=A0ABS4FZZ5_9CLOT|nr:aminotransferase class I/II-fold pyridoxal phosphate-dependent enzyme [Youngiibacter multivorans]MBP1917883.1 dTDP-4-amino-4,6-dideoxygalactose transaminase [Youngiibacter multivorans]
MDWIRFNKPFGDEEIFNRATETSRRRLFDNDGIEEMLQRRLSSIDLYSESASPFFMQSATAALEVMALAMDFKSGDEVIIPSFTYPATANAFVRAGASIVFADIEQDTCNLDPKSVERAITERTRAIVPIHYGGVAADIQSLMDIAKASGAVLLEDAAHCIGASFMGQPLGTFGAMGAVSFHCSKNITSAGSGGCLFVTDEGYREKVSEIIYQGTDRVAYREGKVSSYRWKRPGGEYQMPVFSMAYLEASLGRLIQVTDRRRELWLRYQSQLSQLETEGYIKLCRVPKNAGINGHVFYVLLNFRKERDYLKAHLHKHRIEAFTHYEPLHDTAIGRSRGRCEGDMSVTNSVAGRLLRLPMHMGLKDEDIDRVCSAICECKEV